MHALQYFSQRWILEQWILGLGNLHRAVLHYVCEEDELPDHEGSVSLFKKTSKYHQLSCDSLRIKYWRTDTCFASFFLVFIVVQHDSRFPSHNEQCLGHMVLCMLVLALINFCLKQPSHRTGQLTNAFTSQVSQMAGIRSSNVCLILFNLNTFW